MRIATDFSTGSGSRRRRGRSLGVVSLLGALALSAVLAAPALALPGPVAEELRSAKAPRSALDLFDVVEFRGNTLYRFRQESGGVPVRDTLAVVADAEGAPAELASDETRRGIDPPGSARLSRAEAIATARLATKATELRGEPAARLRIEPGGGGTLVWEALLPSVEPLGDFLVLVDAGSGEVLSKQNLLQEARGAAKLYKPNPVTTNGGYEGLADNGDQDSPTLTDLRRLSLLAALNNGQTCLRGRWAYATNVNSEVCAPGRDFRSVTRADGRFEALMAYYHMTRTQVYIYYGLGFRENAPVNNEQQRTKANSFPEDNAFYSPVTDVIEFGTGGVDDGEDGDVVNHEYGHAVQDAQVPGVGFGNNNDGGAMGEGFGDYLAAVMSILYRGTSTSTAVCVADWDAVSYASPPNICLRRTDLSASLATSGCGPPINIHCRGQIWSSALWELRQEFGADAKGDSVMDVLVIASHFLLDQTPTFGQAVDAIRAVDAFLYGGAHDARIVQEANERGFYP